MWYHTFVSQLGITPLYHTMMPTRIQVRAVTEQILYLEEQIQVLGPVIERMKNVVTKSKAWIEEKTDQSSVSYIELSQELDTAATALLDVTSLILNEDNMDVNKPTPSLPQPDTQTTATYLTVESPRQLKTQVQHTAVEEHPDLERRLAYIETTLSSLQDTQHKSTDDISEIKKWRDNFVTEQSDNWVNIEQSTKKQKQNFKNIRKQINEQDNKVMELNKEIESLKEKETKSNKTLEKLSLDMKEYENNTHKINKEMQAYTDKTDSMTQEIKSLSDLIVSIQDESNKIVVKTSTQFEKLQFKHNLMYQLLQQKLMPIDRLFQIFNQNLETREERSKKLETMENVISKLTMDFNVIESRVCNRYACHVRLADNTPVSTGSIISTFKEVREYNGQHFNRTTGTFVSPHDGLYLVCVTVHEWEDKRIGVGVKAGDEWFTPIEVKCADTSVAGSVVVDMKKGEGLYFYVNHADQGAALSWHSRFIIMPSTIQVKLVTEHTKYLEQQIQLLEPVIGNMKNVVTKSKAWLEEKTDQSSVSYIELSQELDTVATALLEVTSHILNEENLNVNKPTPSLPQPDTETTATFLSVESPRELITQGQHTADMKEYKNNVDKVNKEIQVHTDITDSITQEIIRLSDQIVSLQEDNKTMVNLSAGFKRLQSKLSLICQLLQQRLMPIDRLIQICNQNLETREERKKTLETMENAISKLSMDFNIIESRVCNRYACHVQLDGPTPVSVRSIISTFYKVREYNGQHFNQTTGKFVSPHDGLYLVCVTLHEWEDKNIQVGVWAGDRWCTYIEVTSADTSAAGSVVVDMKKGEGLYFEVVEAHKDAALSWYSSFTIVSL
ncbi:uncharacterized protein LOC131944699 [Physella acuta]|uniref:uncharacterized protein LOC131944699 n=1 Tax=Physella acuta TaxID=109671 RepID=UPI0027DD794B|nr:uncharacterized protein LOC131944699 [Physella acuta]